MPNGIPYYLGSKLKEIADSMQNAILLAAGANPAAAAGTDPRKDHSLYQTAQIARFSTTRGAAGR